ncbi:hypothetical protein RSOCI_06205 [Rhabdochlamydiaceae symbiont of Dictyostelium giganteum]
MHINLRHHKEAPEHAQKAASIKEATLEKNYCYIAHSH